MKETGELLKRARENKNIELETVVLATKIKLSTLKAIECGEGEHLPSKAFIRGFVQSYAKYLGVEEKLILDTFYKEMGSTITVPNLTKSSSRANKSEDSQAVDFANSKRHPLFKGIVVISSIILIIGIVLVSQTIEKYEQERKVVTPAQTAQQDLKPIEETKTDKEDEVVGEAKSSEETLTNSEKLDNKTPVEAANNKTDIKAEAKVEVNTPENSAPTKVVEVKKDEIKVEKKATPSLGSQEVILEALDKLKVEFRTDKGKWNSFTLSPEQIHTIKAKKNIEIKVSDGGSVNVIHNGLDKGVPGNIGEKISLKYP